MNCFRNVLLVFSVAFVKLHTAVEATDYIIPEACQTEQLFYLNGSTMGGSTFIYSNTRNTNVSFQFLFPQHISWEATVTFYTGSRTRVYNDSFIENVDKKSMNFSLTGTWLADDRVSVFYESGDLSPEVCYNRTATNLLVRGVYEVQQMKSGSYSIQARADCGVNVTLYGIYSVSSDQCNVTLKFSDGTTMNENSTGMTVASMNGPVLFDIYSDCERAEVALFYQEDCRSTTAATSESTVSRSPSSGVNVVANALPITFALVLSMVQWL
ncbi:unnamed protein product [Calicophoron daubneyi]|uniref:Uncharacterized protein n=1 Tax=Calicophoron daubneyi TaxID=300641 RepID=A0AAV2T920_CALDB